MMNRLILILVLLLISTTNLYAEEAEKTEKVVVSGFGINPDKAKENAIRNAVEQVIGAYVASESIVKNSQLLKDEILSYSGGYLKETKIVSQGKNEDGLFTVQIEATVTSTKIKRKLESLNIALRKVEGESLFGESFSKINEQKSGSELLKATLSKYPQAAYIIDVGKPVIKSTDSNSSKAKINIPLTFRWDNAFIVELTDVLSKVSKENLKMANMRGLLDLFSLGGSSKETIKAVCISPKALLKSGKAESCAIIDYSVYKNAVGGKTPNPVLEPFGLLYQRPGGLSNMPLFFSFKDANSKIINTYKFIYRGHDHDGYSSDSPKRQGLEWRDDWDLQVLSTHFDNDPASDPNTLSKYRSDFIIVITDGEFNITAEIDTDVNQLSKISTIEVQVETGR